MTRTAWLLLILQTVSLLTSLAQPVSNARAAEPQRLTTDGGFKQHLHWSPNGNHFLLTRIHAGQMAVWLMQVDGTNLRRLHPKERMPCFDANWSPDGKRIVYVFDTLQGTDGKLQINICSADGSDDTVLIPHKAFEESPRFSPDGQRILWISTRDGNPDLYTVRSDGKDLVRLTNDLAFDLHPAWSPDGKRIAFTSGRSGRQKIHVMNADGTAVKKLTDGEFLDAWPCWSPDSKRIAFVSNRGGNSEIWLMHADGTNLRNLTNHTASETSPSWSPDGKRLAFVSTRAGGSDVYVMTVDGN